MDDVLQYVLLGNAALLGAFCCAWLIEKTAILFKLRTAYRLRLHLSVAVLCAAALPLILSPFIPFFASLLSINGTDLLVSQYLKGNISLSATQVSDVLTAKNDVMELAFLGSSLISKLLLTLFIIAAFWRAAYISINVFRVRHHIILSRLVHKSRRVEVRYSDNLTVPFSTRGFFKYYIVIPTKLAHDHRSLRIALGHEAQHIRQGDVDWEILLSIASPLFALNPAFWLITDRIRRFREYTCDAIFLKNNSIAAREYCLLLLHIASEAAKQKADKRQVAHAASVPFFGRDGMFNRTAKNTLRKRIIALTQGASFLDEGASRYVNLVPAALLFMIVGTGIVMSAKPADWSHDRLMLSTVVNLERLDRINSFGAEPYR